MPYFPFHFSPDNIMTYIFYGMINDMSYDKIQEHVQKYLDKSVIINNSRLIAENHPDSLFQYTKTCSHLLNIIESLIDKMNNHSINSITETYNDDIIHELAFATCVKPNSFNVYLNHWKSHEFKLPFILIKDLMINKGYIVDVITDGYRDHLYADWTTTYTVKVTRNLA
jgi:transposase